MSRCIISLTSYPERFPYLDRVLESINNQSVEADKIILTLCSEESTGYSEIVTLCEKYQKLEILWCDTNLRPHNKYFYVMCNYPNDIIITVDDDIIYEENMVETLLQGYELFPNSIIAGRAHIMLREGEKLAPYWKWWYEAYEFQNETRFDLIATGVGGVLYPPHILPQEAFCEEGIKRLCLTADDIWLKAMELMAGVPVMLVSDHFMGKSIREADAMGLSRHENAENANGLQFENIISYYGERAVWKYIRTTDLMSRDIYNKHIEHLFEQHMKLLIDVIKKYELIAIYGAGSIGHKIMRLLIEYNCCDNIECFLVSEDKTLTQGEICGKSVRIAGEDINVEAILVAVTPQYRDEIIKTIDSRYNHVSTILIDDAIIRYLTLDLQ